MTSASGERVEQGRLAGIGVADQRHDRIRHALAGAAVQAAGALHLLQLLADLGEALADQAAVGLDLGFARPAEEAEAAALPLEMGPAAHQPAALIGEMRQFDLQAAFARRGALAEDFEDQRRAVEHLHLPGALEIALLDRRELGIDDDDFGFEPARLGRDLLDLAAADQGRRRRARQRHDVRGDDVEADGRRQPDRFVKTGLRIAPRPLVGHGAMLMRNMQDKGRARGCTAVLPGLVGVAQAVSSAPLSASCSWIGPSGMTVEIACL